MLNYRLIYGTLMTAFFAGIAVLDGWLDGSATAALEDDKPVQGTLLGILLAVVLVLAVIEFSRLAAAKGFAAARGVCSVGVILLATLWYWPQLFSVAPAVYAMCVVVLTLFAMTAIQYVRSGVDGVIGNCGAGSLALIYLGGFGAFILATRIEVGLWETLTLIFVVKCSDIGAYTFGSLFGKHKLAPRVSPGKTWEGLVGAIAVAMGVSLALAGASGIMSWWLALIFGACFAVIGQVGDLTESMLKRDAGQKDSSRRVPGFGGILDVIDSPLFAAPFGYLFFRIAVQ